MPCKALVPFQFLDGTTIPAGTIVGTIPPAIHDNESFYANPGIFEGLRSGFSSEREQVSSDQSVSSLCLTGIGNTYLSFG
ncbi:hypothetical protein B0H10DRAFT_1799886 [Mycena sp. CBHHK59/15]|nr:hypothetical protein B0H10DRAFT_1799886 [Mycena sp. CBHHK59/15]